MIFFANFGHKISHITNSLILLQYCMKYGEIRVIQIRLTYILWFDNHSQAVGAQAKAHPTGRLAQHFPKIYVIVI